MTYVYLNDEQDAYSVEKIDIEPGISFTDHSVRIVLSELDNKMTQQLQFKKLESRINRFDLFVNTVRLVNHQDIMQEELCMKEVIVDVVERPYGRVYELECILPNSSYSLSPKKDMPTVKSDHMRRKRVV